MAEFFRKLAAYADRPEPTGALDRGALLATMTGRALRSAWRLRAFDRPPIVIGGCGRSGTTLLLSVLSAHPHIFALSVESIALCPTGYREPPNLAAPLEMRKLYRLMLLHDIAPTCRRWCEKTPRNVLFFGRILDHFGDRVRLIHLVRDGRDVVTSRHPTDPGRTWVTPERWVRDVGAGRRFDDHPQVHTVRYEDLLRSPPETLQEICDFLGESYHPHLADWHQHATVRSNAAWFGRVRPLHQDSVARWQRPEHAAVVSELLSNEAAAALLQHYGYT